jgi:hypothetical protein
LLTEQLRNYRNNLHRQEQLRQLQKQPCYRSNPGKDRNTPVHAGAALITYCENTFGNYRNVLSTAVKALTATGKTLTSAETGT